MKLLHYAIASIVDANTGLARFEDSGDIDYEAAGHRASYIRSKSIHDFLRLLGERIADGLASLRQYRELKRGIEQLAALSDRSLDDIGLTRGDIIALQTGQIDQAQLEARRLHNRGKSTIQPTSVSAPDSRGIGRNAINDAIFARAKCA